MSLCRIAFAQAPSGGVRPFRDARWREHLRNRLP